MYLQKHFLLVAKTKGIPMYCCLSGNPHIKYFVLPLICQLMMKQKAECS